MLPSKFSLASQTSTANLSFCKKQPLCHSLGIQMWSSSMDLWVIMIRYVCARDEKINNETNICVFNTCWCIFPDYASCRFPCKRWLASLPTNTEAKVNWCIQNKSCLTVTFPSVFTCSHEQLPHPNLSMTCLDFCRQVALGMVYLSRKGFVHRNLAARSIFISETNICKVHNYLCWYNNVIPGNALEL